MTPRRMLPHTGTADARRRAAHEVVLAGEPELASVLAQVDFLQNETMGALGASTTGY